MALTLLNVYNDVAGQAWSMYDGEVEDKDEFESSLKSSIQKALTELWCSYPFPFTIRESEFKTVADISTYDNVNGNIIKRKINDKNRYCVKIKNGNYLDVIEDLGVIDDKVGMPTNFYVKNDKIVLYPKPDNEFTIQIEYQTLQMGLNIDDEHVFILTEDSDKIDIPAKYEEIFKNALITLSMVYGIADETDENYSSYYKQYQGAYKTLLKYSRGINKDNKVVW